MRYVLLQTTMLCMWITVCLEPINGCVKPIIYDTSAYVTNVWVFSLVPKYLSYLMDEFFVSWSLLLLSYQIYILLTRESNHLMKN
jgi:hypothetical protein